MNRVIIIFIILVFYSCGEKQESENKIEKAISELKGFELAQDFQKHKAEFKTDTIKLTNDHGNVSGLIVYRSKEFNYLVLNFMVYVETGIQNHIYWTDENLNFKFIEQLNLAYKRDDLKIGHSKLFLSYEDAKVKLFDINKNQVTNKELVQKTKLELESFFKKKTEKIELIK